MQCRLLIIKVFRGGWLCLCKSLPANPGPDIFRTIHHAGVLQFRQEPHAWAVHQSNFTQIYNHVAIRSPRAFNFTA